MKNAFLFYYDHSKTGTLEDFYIRGIGVHEKMSPGMIRHGDENYPWLFIYFHTPAVVHTESGPMKFNHSLTIWEPTKLHIYGNEISEWDHSWLIVKSSAIRPILESSGIPLNTPLDADTGEIFEKYLPLLYSEINRPDCSHYLLERVLELFLFEINRTMKRPTQPIFRKLEEIERYMTQYLDQPLSIEGIAELFHISPPHFMASFKECYGTSPMRYLNQKRMERAAFFLRNYPYSCKEIAEKTGFGDPLYFSRRFHQYWGIAPNAYRKKK